MEAELLQAGLDGLSGGAAFINAGDLDALTQHSAADEGQLFRAVQCAGPPTNVPRHDASKRAWVGRLRCRGDVGMQRKVSEDRVLGTELVRETEVEESASSAAADRFGVGVRHERHLVDEHAQVQLPIGSSTMLKWVLRAWPFPNVLEEPRLPVHLGLECGRPTCEGLPLEKELDGPGVRNGR